MEEFTFGLEVEGLFSESFLDSCEKYVSERKEDGSVRVSHICDENNLENVDIAYSRYNDCDDDCDDYRESENYCSEISSKVLSKEDLFAFLKKLKKAVKDGWWFDKSCGIHLHFKSKDKMFRDYKTYNFINKAQNYAKKKYKKLVDTGRLGGNSQWSKCYGEYSNWKDAFNTGDKYRFIRNHYHYGTLEARFFSPLTNFYEEITDFVNFITGYEYNDVTLNYMPDLNETTTEKFTLGRGMGEKGTATTIDSVKKKLKIITI